MGKGADEIRRYYVDCIRGVRAPGEGRSKQEEEKSEKVSDRKIKSQYIEAITVQMLRIKLFGAQWLPVNQWVSASESRHRCDI